MLVFADTTASTAGRQAWDEVLLDVIRKSIDQFIPRLEAVAGAEGGPIDHLNWYFLFADMLQGSGELVLFHACIFFS